MGKFSIRGIEDRYIEVIDENAHEYLIHYVKDTSDSSTSKEETMSKALFEYCISSGYFLK